MYFRLIAAMFNLPVNLTSESHTSPTVLLDSENVGVANGISLLSYIQADIYMTFHTYFLLMAAISGLEF
jgi:hypothetical protein